MKNNLLEARLNSILENKQFSSKNKSLSNYINKETGIFINDFFLVLEFEDIDPKIVQNKKDQLREKNQLDHIDKDDNTVKYVAIYLWVFNLSAGQFMETDENKIAFRIPIDLQTYNIFKPSDLQTQSAKTTTESFDNVFCLSKKNGEQTLQIINSNLDEYQIAIYTEKQIYVGHIESLLKSLKQKQPNQLVDKSFTMYRVQLLIQKYSPSILSVKFHKLSPHHLAVLLDDQYFIVYNLQSSLSYHEAQYNLSKIPRYLRSDEQNIIDQNKVTFIDFEFGGSSDFSIQSQNKSNSQSISDFDFLSVYFLTEEGHIYYQSPFLVKDMRIDREILEQLKQYLISEITLVEQHELIEEKTILLKGYLSLVEQIETNDLITECEQPTHLTKSFVVGQNTSKQIEVPILNTVSMQELENQNFKVQLVQIVTEKGEDEEEEDSQQEGSHLHSHFKSSMISQKQGKNVFSKSVMDRVLSRNQSDIMHRKFNKLHKVESTGALHVFILTKQTGNKSYSTIQSRFSPLPVMPTNIITDFYQFRLISGEKAHLENPIDSNINFTAKPERKQIYEMKQYSCARLCSKTIHTSNLDSVCFSLLNRIYCINFRWIQNLIQTNLSDPRVFNDEKSSKSEIRVLVDSKIINKDNIDQFKSTDFYFYSLIEKDRMLLALVPQQDQQPFRLKCFTLDYLSNYIQIQKSAKLINETLHKLIKAQVDSDLYGVSVTKQEKAPLQQNKVKIQESENSKQVADLVKFDQQIQDYIKEHEKVLKENVVLIKDRYSEVLKKKQQLEEKKKETESKIHEIIRKKQEELIQSKNHIQQRNENIHKKIQGIVELLRNPKIEQQIGSVDGLAVGISDNYSEQTKEYYDKLKGIQEQYENYFKKRSEFLETLGNHSNSNLQLDQQTLYSIFETSKKVNKHIQILDNQISLNSNQK